MTGSHATRRGYAQSNDRSVIGFRGAEDLADGVQALFRVEGTLAPDTGATHYTAGWDYAFSTRTSVFFYYTLLRNDRNGVYDFGINSPGAGAGSTLKGSALGLRHNF